MLSYVAGCAPQCKALCLKRHWSDWAADAMRLGWEILTDDIRRVSMLKLCGGTAIWSQANGGGSMDQQDATLERLQRIKVIGIGGGGSNAVQRMIDHGIAGVDFITINTSVKKATASQATMSLQIGNKITHGLSTGGDMALGTKAAEAARSEIEALLEDTDMVFVAATLGGGTGTGAAPIVAGIAKEKGILTVAVVTKPFSFEGSRKMQTAEAGLETLRKAVDAEIVISNDRLLTLDRPDLKLTEAFALADEMLQKAVQTVCDFVLRVGVINVDLRDVIAILTNGGRTMVNVTSASGEDRAIAAAQAAVTSPLLDITVSGAAGLLLNIEGSNLSLGEVHEAAELITRTAAPDADIIWGYVENDDLDDEIKITVIATGYQLDENGQPIYSQRVKDSPIDLDLDVPTRLRR